jgi:hypothetical protein
MSLWVVKKYKQKSVSTSWVLWGKLKFFRACGNFSKAFTRVKPIKTLTITALDFHRYPSPQVTLQAVLFQCVTSQSIFAPLCKRFCSSGCKSVCEKDCKLLLLLKCFSIKVWDIDKERRGRWHKVSDDYDGSAKYLWWLYGMDVNWLEIFYLNFFLKKLKKYLAILRIN